MVLATESANHFALKYRGCGIVGLLACLHLFGKYFHQKIFPETKNSLGAGCPPALVGGLIGLLCFVGLKQIFGLNSLVDNARSQLQEMVLTLQPHAFAALTLGFACGSSFGGKNTAMDSSSFFISWHQLGTILWHEVLGWGNSVVALSINLLWRFLDLGGAGLSTYLLPTLGAVITIGLEDGRHDLPSQTRDIHAASSIHLAANVGLLLSLSLGCLLLAALKYQPQESSSSISSSLSSSSSSSSASSSATASSKQETSRVLMDSDEEGGEEGYFHNDIDDSSHSTRYNTDSNNANNISDENITQFFRSFDDINDNQYHNGDFVMIWLRKLLFGRNVHLIESTNGHRSSSSHIKLLNGEDRPQSNSFNESSSHGVSTTLKRRNPSHQQSSEQTIIERHQQMFVRSLSADELDSRNIMKKDDNSALLKSSHSSHLIQQGSFSSVGAHVMFIAISVFVGYLWLLMLMALETSLSWLHHHSVLSSIRLFKVSMIVALLLVRLSNKTFIQSCSLRKERFHNLCSLILALLVMGSIASLEWSEPLAGIIAGGGNGVALVGMFEVTVLSIAIWNIFAIRKLAPIMFPNFQFQRATILVGDSLGHSWVGLLFATHLDPTFSTPLTLAFTSKMLLSVIIPTSSSKNQLVISSIEMCGLLPTLGFCVALLYLWLYIQSKYFTPRWPRKMRPHGLDHHRTPSPETSADKESSTSMFNLDRNNSSTHNNITTKNSSNTKYENYGNDNTDNSNDGLTMNDVIREDEIIDICCNQKDITIQKEEKEFYKNLKLPKLSENSSILQSFQIYSLVLNLPNEGQKLKDWNLVYSLVRDGASVETLIDCCQVHASYILVVRDSWDYVFGASFSHALTSKEGNNYYGTGESWLFSFGPTDKIETHRWTMANELFVLSGPVGFGIAFGGGGGFGLHLDDDLDNGASSPCATFGNQRLSSSEFFKTLNVEVWRLDALLGVTKKDDYRLRPGLFSDPELGDV